MILNEAVRQALTAGKTGLLENYLVISGHARITEGGAPELLHQLAQVYLGPGSDFPPSGSPPGYITHIQIERVHGHGPWRSNS